MIGDDKNDRRAEWRQIPLCVVTTADVSSSGAVHAKVDPLDTELVPVVVDSRLFPARCGRQLPLACAIIFKWGRVWMAPLG